VAAPTGLDVDALALELLRLERRERDLTHQLELALQRNERWPNAVAAREVERRRSQLEPVLSRLLELRVALHRYV
jgi:hypothetical protein